MHEEDLLGDMSPKPRGLIDDHRSDHDGRKASHPDNFPTELDHKELKRKIRRVARLKDKQYGRRLELKEKRNELRQEYRLLGEIDSRFIKIVRQFREHPKEGFDDSCYNQLDAQRNVIGLLQYDYDQFEDEYDVDENHLEQEEKTLLKLLSRFLRLDSNEEDTEESTSDSSSPFRTEPEPPDPTKARLMEYESRIGDARILQEQLQDLRYDQGRRLSFSKKREKLGVGRDASDASENFESRYAEVAKELSIINADVQHLKEALQVDGCFFPELSASGKQESVPALQLHPPSFPMRGRKARSTSVGIMPLLAKKVAVLQDRIDRWMFVTFGDSPVEHVRHKVILRDLCSLDDDTWAHVVPEYWTDEVVPSDDGFDASMLRSGTLKAEEAMKAFERDFPLTEAPKDRATPYNDKLEFDMLSQYECRSN